MIKLVLVTKCYRASTAASEQQQFVISEYAKDEVNKLASKVILLLILKVIFR